MILHPPTFNAAFKVAGTASFRLASTQWLKTKGVGYGGNLQNIPDEQRRVFIPRPGYTFVQCDLEGAEAVAVALLVPEGNFRDLVRLGIKIHNYLCIKLFPELFTHLGITPALTPAELKAHPSYKAFVKYVKSLRREYDLAKRTVHGCLTGKHEILTRNGWLPLYKAVDDETLEICVVNRDGSTHFERPAYVHKYEYHGDLYTFYGAGFRMTTTPDHGIAVLEPAAKQIIKIRADSMPYYRNVTVPVLSTLNAKMCGKELTGTPLRHASATNVYCYTTSTGLFLVRSGDSDATEPYVTGNSNYGMAWKTFQDTVLKGTRGRVVLTAAEAKRFLAIYFEVFPEIKFFQIGLEEAVKNGVTIRNLFGHPVTFVRRFTADLARTGISWIPQSTVGQCSNIAAIKLAVYIRECNKTWIINNIVHDSILAEAPADEVAELVNITAQCLTFAFKSPLDGWECTIGVEKQVGKNWGKYDETENPDGMKVI